MALLYNFELIIRSRWVLPDQGAASPRTCNTRRPRARHNEVAVGGIALDVEAAVCRHRLILEVVILGALVQDLGSQDDAADGQMAGLGNFRVHWRRWVVEAMSYCKKI